MGPHIYILEVTKFYHSYFDQAFVRVSVCVTAPDCSLQILCRNSLSVQKTPSFSYHNLQL